MAFLIAGILILMIAIGIFGLARHFDWWEAKIGSLIMMAVGMFLFIVSASYIFS